MALGNDNASKALVVAPAGRGGQAPGFCYLAGTDFAGDRPLKLRMGGENDGALLRAASWEL
jgi:hypothetical protein